MAVSSAQANEAQSVQDTQDINSNTIPAMLEDSCVDLDSNYSVGACVASAKIETTNLGYSMQVAIDKNEISGNEVQRVIVPVITQEKSCQDFASRREAAFDAVRDAVLNGEYGDLWDGQGTNWADSQPPSDKLQNLAEMFSDMSSCYEAVDNAIMTSGSSALQEKAALYRNLANQADVVQKRFSAKIQP